MAVAMSVTHVFNYNAVLHSYEILKSCQKQMCQIAFLVKNS